MGLKQDLYVVDMKSLTVFTGKRISEYKGHDVVVVSKKKTFSSY